MVPTLILGATGSGKTTALMERYTDWVRRGIRTDEILVLTAHSVQSAMWRRQLPLECHGPIEAHSFFGFVQRELTLFWAPVQAAYPSLSPWVRPEFLNVEIAHHLMRGLLESAQGELSTFLKASPQRIAIQIASNLSTVAASAGLSPTETVKRLASADRPDREPLYTVVHRLLEDFRERCLGAGLLDYSLSLHLFTTVLLTHAPYLDHLRNRYRCLMVDDLDESVSAEQDFVATVAEQMERVALSFGTDGGHSVFMGADPSSALSRFRPGADIVEFGKSHTCSQAAFELGGALAVRIMGDRPPREEGVVQDQLTADFRGDLVHMVSQAVLDLLGAGAAPSEVAVLAPYIDTGLETTLRRTLDGVGVRLRNCSLSHRLLDEPYARAIITLAGLVHPHWQIPRDSAGAITAAVHVLLRFDPIRASVLGDAIWRSGTLPDLDETGLRRRIGFDRGEAYDHLRGWITEARRREWPTDEFVQAVVAEVIAPLSGDLSVSALHACQQLLVSAQRFRTAMERFGEGAYGSEYIRMLTEGTVAADPLDGSDSNDDAVILATPYAYLRGRFTSQYQVWVDTSSSGWYPNDVKELANPHVLSRRWEEGTRWTDQSSVRARQTNAARTVRALVRRCRGQILLVECAVNPWGQDQEGGLAEAFGDVLRRRRAAGERS